MALPTLIARYNRPSFGIEMPKKDSQSEADIMQATLIEILALNQIQIIAQYLSLFPKFVDHNDKDTINGSIDHEIHAYVIGRIRETRGARICDIGCGGGELGLLFAHAGAHVTFNDNNGHAVTHLRSRVQTLPTHIQAKCTFVEGNCLGLLMNHPELKKNIDFVFCRNLLHLLSLSDQIKLLEIVKEMLKANGQAIFVTNSIYSWGNILPKDCEWEDEQAPACFYVQDCIVERPDFPRRSTILYSKLSACAEEEFSLQATIHYIYSKSADTDGKWKPSSKKIQHTVVPRELLTTVQQTMKNREVNAYLKVNYCPGRIKARFSYIHIYNVNNLPRLFRTNGFDVLSTVLVDIWGHLVLDHSKRFEQGQQIAVIASPSK
jgi:2-polyprenyl-3-methyl-5-hydroxy-6-metoxy-1,4-benzoquinol methylase